MFEWIKELFKAEEPEQDIIEEEIQFNFSQYENFSFKPKQQHGCKVYFESKVLNPDSRYSNKNLKSDKSIKRTELENDYVESLQNGYKKLLKENEELKHEVHGVKKIIWKLDQKQEDLAVENLSLKAKNDRLQAVIDNLLITEIGENELVKDAFIKDLSKKTENEAQQSSSINLSVE